MVNCIADLLTDIPRNAPGDGVAQQRRERVGFPYAAEGGRRLVRRVGGPGGADGGVVAMAERKVGDAATADRTGIAEHAGPAVRLQGGVRRVERADGGRGGARAVIR